jgi:hypothetical protein
MVPRVWQDLKFWLSEKVFFGKCAYCEWPLGRSFGAADHYRPKSRVTIREAGQSIVVLDGSGRPHKGYYWLAYRWENLLPSCDRCNTGEGKVDQFPVDGHRIFDAQSLSDPASISEIDAFEVPQLINPYFDDPSDHLRFGLEGVIAGRTDRGRITILVCQLDEAKIEAARKAIQEVVQSAVADAYYQAAMGRMALPDALNQVREKYAGKSAGLSAAAEFALIRFIERLNINLTDVHWGSANSRDASHNPPTTRVPRAGM